MIDYFDVGYPNKFGSCHIGLYQPVIKRFLITVCSLDHAREILLIAGGRYPLYPVNLVTAENYCENLIDNYCCDAWGLSDLQIVPTTDNYYVDYYINADKLVNYPKNLLDLSCEKAYLQLIWYYVKFFEKIMLTNVYVWRTKRFMADIFDCNDRRYVTVQTLKKQVIQQLFLGKDLNQIQSTVENLIISAKKEHDLVF